MTSSKKATRRPRSRRPRTAAAARPAAGPVRQLWLASLGVAATSGELAVGFLDELVVRGREQEPKTLAAARRMARDAQGTANGWVTDATKLGKQWIDQAFDRLGVPDRPRQKNVFHRLGDLAEALL